jgi:hypothetical protein
MKALTRRLDAVELASGVNGGWDIRKPCHVIIMDETQPHVEALAEYRAKFPDKAINPDDNVMWIQLVSPELDANGSVIPKEPAKQGMADGPSLADILALEAAQ